jgi:hypothetical protein
VRQATRSLFFRVSFDALSHFRAEMSSFSGQADTTQTRRDVR